MPDENTNQTNQTTPPPEPADNSGAEDTASNTSILSEINAKIADAQNILIALSSDPTVDELAAALGLSIHLDKLGKHATAIYSGSTPNALEFLKPSETFEPTVDALQDFVIALSKEKADHLRYKLDGDFVKVYITPYRNRISKDDLEFSYGDFNIDLVLALNVANGIDLDDALREHGRIMHDASIINITAGNPGKFGEIEWSDKSASSVSEMVARLLFSADNKLDEEESTALLTGIVAATNRFSNAKTSPITMQVSSQLMESGANQQLISKNITPDNGHKQDQKESKSDKVEQPLGTTEVEENEDSTKLDISHKDDEKKDEQGEAQPDEDIIKEPSLAESVKESPEIETPAKEEPEKSDEDSLLMDDLKAAEASLSQAGAETTPVATEEPFKIDDSISSRIDNNHIMSPDSLSPEEKTLAPPVDFSADTSEDNKYGKMLEDALASAGEDIPTAPEPITAENINNPAALSAPTVSETPEINGVPQINYATPADATILPPPPAPPVTGDGAEFMPTPTEPVIPAPTGVPMPEVAPIEPATPLPAPTAEPLGPQPAMQDQVYTPQAADPSAFQIPGV